MAETTSSDAQAPPIELEELCEFLDEPSAPKPLELGALLEYPEGKLRIDTFLCCKGPVNLYDVTINDDRSARLSETQEGNSAERFRHEFAILGGLNCPMFPRTMASFESNGKSYFATESIVGPTLADALASKEIGAYQLLSALAQVAFAVSQLHMQRWSHLALRPSTIVMGKPVRLTDLTRATQFGQRPPSPFYFPGYSAPELLSDRPIDGRADIYSIGALLFHALSGYPIAESGSALAGWQPETPVAGIPQILHRCLNPIETRYASASELHRDLLRLVSRCAPRTIFEHASATSIGLEPTRTVNQDAYGWLSMDSDSEEVSRKWAVVAVADGMGGMAAGERASAVAIDSLLATAMSALSPSSNARLEDQAQFTADLVRTANDRVCDAMEAKQVRGGCTLACALVIGRRLSIAHVGDCRIYLIQNGDIEMLTRDHSVAMSLVLQGQLDMKDLRTYPDRSNVTRSLGERRKLPDYYVDTLKQTKADQYLELQSGDTLMICSDGLWEPVTEEAAIQALAEAGSNLNAAADKLINLAIQGGAPDNATVGLLRIGESFPQ